MNSEHDILDLAAELRSAHKSYALITVVRTEPATASKPGAKAIVDADGTLHGWIGGNCSRTAVVKTAKAVLDSGRPQLIRVGPKGSGAELSDIVDFGSGCPSGGIMDIFIEPVLAPATLVILGESSIARSLATLAARVGFIVQVGAPGADPARFPDAAQVHDTLRVDADTLTRPCFALVATQGQQDLAGLEAALAVAPDYIGFVASRRKAARLAEKLRARGHAEEAVAAIEAPAGVDIGAQSPEEIALSVLAGIVRARRRAVVTRTSAAAS